MPPTFEPPATLWQTDCTLTVVQVSGGCLASDRLSLDDVNGSTSPRWSSQMWYATQTRVRREQLTATLLARRGYEIFLPTYVPERRGGYREVEPLFPGFLFGQFDGSYLECGPQVRITEHAFEGLEGISVGAQRPPKDRCAGDAASAATGLEAHRTRAIPKHPNTRCQTK